eukprot:TRINITY_DN529_c4_g1_i1.p1 TRINITY_DN529_c4_g1~~TRINITY_DN529_c4_g1_i1.p1  ORF type:complete len:404 (+),score=70.22 TRINITY_DN529_c4_g1_i1:6833-8044(+)
MHKMVAKPSLIADDTLNGKIERMFNNALFQRMVERADIIQDMDYEDEEDTALPLATEKAQEQFIKRVAAENKPPPKDEEELPHFGAVPVETIVTPAKIKEPALPPKNTVQKPADDSFGAIDNSKQSPVASPKKGEEEKMPSVIISGEGDSGFVDGSQSIVLAMDTTGGVDEYTDDDDPGFVIQEVPEEYFERVCKELAEKFGYPARSIKPEPRDKKKPEDKEEEEDNSAEKSKNDSAVFDLGLSKSKKGKEKKGKDKEETKKVQHKKEDKSEDGIKKLENLINKVDDSQQVFLSFNNLLAKASISPEISNMYRKRTSTILLNTMVWFTIPSILKQFLLLSLTKTRWCLIEKRLDLKRLRSSQQQLTPQWLEGTKFWIILAQLPSPKLSRQFFAKVNLFYSAKT